MEFRVACPECPEVFVSHRSISEVMTSRRDHLEQRHLEAKIEMDT